MRFAACLVLLLAAAPSLAAVDLDALWDFGQPGLSERRFRQAIDRQGLPSSDDALVLRTQLARSLGLQKRFGAAHNALDAVALFAPDAGPEVRVRLWLERGRVHRSAGEPALALPFFERAHTLAEAEAMWDLAGDALHMVPLVMPAGEPQLAAHRRALDFVRGMNNARARAWEGPVLNNYGNDLRTTGQLDQALGIFREARQVFARLRSPGGERIARWQVANVLRLLGRHDEALAMQQALAQEHERGGGSDAHVFDELALLSATRGDDVQAGRYRALAAAARGPAAP